MDHIALPEVTSDRRSRRLPSLPEMLIAALVLGVVLVGILSTSCGSRTSGGSAASAASAASASTAAAGAEAGAAAKAAHRLTLPVPPAALSTDSARLDYVVSHYWDSFDRRDTTWITDTMGMEQAFANWTGVLRYLPEAQAAQSIKEFLRSTEVCVPVRDRVLEVAERYFYDPNSPLRNESLYIPVLQYIIASPSFDQYEKIRPQAQLALALKNRPGMTAADFACTTADGRTARLSTLRSAYTLLLFYNPGCPDCARVEEFIAKSPDLAPRIASGEVKMLAVYTEGDLDLWRKHAPYLPKNWTVAYDKGEKIAAGELYDLRAIPCLYLLDAQKRVILKDAPVEQVAAWLAATQKQEAQR